MRNEIRFRVNLHEGVVCYFYARFWAKANLSAYQQIRQQLSGAIGELKKASAVGKSG